MRKIFLLTLFLITSLLSYEELTEDNFAEKIRGKNVIVDFYAPWCPPCKILANNLEDFEIQKSDNIEIFKVNIDNDLILAKMYRVKQLPTLIYFKNGEPIKRYVGIQTTEELLKSSQVDFN
ncbi:thioredoxin family protein [Aliarcobacter lanthieri]|uniref:thioredoxin family protein n=1 Tax=Aliarcobacter lanthieri TaxID=1355374 RepID=UPI001924E3D2|nr:thioredoxin family protein [Aliarcobacter lanthieri]MBL3519203.1 thioredoxin family protein [Aliarcobacter lanthieri]